MEAPRMLKEEAKSRIGDPDFVVIDVRRSREKEKIPHAAFEDPDKADDWMKKYPKDKTLLLYCS